MLPKPHQPAFMSEGDNRTNLVITACGYKCLDGQSEITPTFMKPGGHMQGPKILSGHLWKKYGCGVLFDILHPCHRFLQTGFSPRTFWPLEHGGGVWSHGHPQKVKAPACFCFWTCFLLFWLVCMCANNENELMLHINEVIRRAHKSPLFDGEGSRLISWSSFRQIRVTSGSLTQSVQHQEGVA